MTVMWNSGQKKYSNSCVVRKKISERNKIQYPPPFQVKWSVPNKYVIIVLCVSDSNVLL